MVVSRLSAGALRTSTTVAALSHVGRRGAAGSVGAVIELTTGQAIPLPRTRITMGIGWDKDPRAGAIGTGRPDIDLDASVLEFSGGTLFDLAFFNNLTTRDGAVTHLGDNKTGRGEGDDEAVAVDLPAVHGPVDTLFLVVTSYHGHSLTWVDNAYVRVRDADGQAFARYTITSGPDAPGLVLARLTRATDPTDDPGEDAGDSTTPSPSGHGAWTLHALGAGLQATTAPAAAALLRAYL